ncbi:N-acetyltransferase [Neptunitalea chrysea]|uniref:N-acetyltransferase n=1 Tax=Neptunitalea chrysea TaxID=1647581 RepID=A0A9W6B7E2_9FLAO|nr:GNAT family N-acetyltransferase [Neptunitalea chrysea]GLB52935.1 N-acetyltransferase [Neptunitalea chrysea]
MNIMFEEVLENDVFLIRELALKVWPDTFKSILSEQQIAYMMDMMYSVPALQEQLKNNCRFLIIKKEDSAVGFVSFEIGYNQNPEVTKLHKIYILSEYQSKGLGKITINKVATIAKENNCTILALNVNRYNANAIISYEKIGFTKTKVENINIGNGYLMEDYIMEKKLTN